jgi:hypothetical protein
VKRTPGRSVTATVDAGGPVAAAMAAGATATTGAAEPLAASALPPAGAPVTPRKRVIATTITFG